MLLFPAIDLVDGKAVRLYKGDFAQMTVYSDTPWEVAKDFASCGCKAIHVVDLEGARDGNTPNFDTVLKIKKESGLFVEIGGGIRSFEVIDKYVSAGIDRVILGTVAAEDPEFTAEAVKRYGEKIAVGVDIKNGEVATRGWLKSSGLDAFEFCEKMQSIGVRTLICTDISKDGAMKGTNRELYRQLSEKFSINITASGGVSSLEDVEALKKLDLYGAIIGKAYYTGDIDLRKAEELAR